MMHPRNFSFDKIKNKVSGGGRRSSESSILEIASAKSADRRNSISNPMIIISESLEKKKHSSSNMNISSSTSNSGGRFRAQSLSLNNGNSRSRSRSVSKKQTKELIKQETAQVISKKLLHVLLDLGLQQPIPLKTTNGNINGPSSKTAKVYVANTNDCIYLAPASSASFTYEDVENGGIPQGRSNQDLMDNDDDDDDDDDEYDHVTEDGDLNGSPLSTSLRINNNESAVLSDDDDDDYDDGLLSPPTRSRANSSNISQNNHPNLKSIPKRLRRKMQSFNSPNYLCTKIDSDTPIPHTFAVIIELDKEISVRDVNIEFQSLTNILWPSSDPYNKTFVKEKFNIGHMEWKTSLDDADFYINISNSNDVKLKNITTLDLAKRTREYKLTKVKDLADGNYPSSFSSRSSIHLEKEPSNPIQSPSTSNTTNSADMSKPGLYVFLLPILLPEHIPPTISSINGSLIHNLSVNFNKTSVKLSRKSKVCASYNLPMVRIPPSFANSIADKPIYVNRVWNDALHYIITFPKKYVSLGSEHLINVKLVPLVKDVIIKRIKFNVLERITYVCKDLSREYDYDGDDPYYLRPLTGDNKTRERVVPVCELKTKNKSTNGNKTDPYKEEIIKCPDNNLLFSCYEPENDNDSPKDDDPLSKTKNDFMIASPLDINIALPFLTTRSDKTIMTSSLNNQDDDNDNAFVNPLSSSSSRKASINPNNRASIASADVPHQNFNPSSPVIGALETSISHGNPDIGKAHKLSSHTDEEFKPDVSSLMAEESHNLLKENIQQGYTTVSKALSPDSNFRHIQIHHRLQVCFRISKPDPKDDYKMHHYEVVVDTPLILLSAKCNDDSIQLPKYDEIDSPQPQFDQQNTNNQGSISFRTPNFEHNGVSIKPLVQDEGEQLPSFEEAISAPSSPITRSISLGDDPLSRIPSIIPKEPAPAYELSLSPSASPKESHEPVNIDELVHKNSGTNASNARQSRIRSSLLNSFAPTSSNLSSQAPSNTSPSVSLSLAARNSTLSENTDYSPDNALSSIATSSSNGLNSSVPSEDSISSSSKSDESSLCLNNSNTNIPQPHSTHNVDVQRMSNQEASRDTESEVAPIRSVDAAVSTVMDHEAKKAQELANAKDKVTSQNNIDNSDSVPSAGLNIIQDESISRIHGDKLSKVLKDNNNKFDPTSSVDSLNAVQTQKSNQDDELSSLFTQETQETSFDQRLPLLQHQSFDDSLQRSVSSLGAKNYLNSTLVNNDTSRNPRGIMKQLTDNLSVVTEADHHQAQDINHRF